MIVVCTPTGLIGRQVLDRVLDAGRPVRVIARDPARLSERAHAHAEVVRGSLTDPAVLGAAFAGAEAVFWLVPPDPHADSAEAHTLAFTRPLCEALAARGVPRLVSVAGLNHRGDPDAGPAAAGRIKDELIAKTGVAHRVLRMPAFMENTLQQVGAIATQGRFFLPISPDRKVHTCATRDVAAVAAGLLLDGSWHGQEAMALLGPEDLSYDDMARIMSDVLARPVRYQQVPGEAFRETLVRNGMSEAWAQGLVNLLTAVDRGLVSADPGTPRSTTPTTFRQWCTEVLRPAVRTRLGDATDTNQPGTAYYRQNWSLPDYE